jgi:hypothetical protein
MMEGYLSKYLLPLKILLFLFPGILETGELYKLFGVVRDSSTGVPLPYTNIRILGTTRGATTNDSGMYMINLEPGRHRLVFSYLGYRSETLEICIKKEDIERDIYLSPTFIPLEEIVVSPYNPAERIILKAISKKREFLSLLKTYEFMAYTKTVLRMIDKEKNGDTTIVGILETQTKGYWKSPDRYKEVIVARRQTANFIPEGNIFTVGKIPNFNEDYIRLERNKVISPTSPNALRFYNYELVDTTAIDDILIFRIRITPKYENIPLFKGIISIADSTYLVANVDVSGNDALDLSPIQDFHIREQFAHYGEFWLPIEIDLNYKYKFGFPSVPEIYVERVSLIHNYRINNPIPDSIFDELQLETLPDVDKDSIYWSKQQVIPLTPEEIQAYRRIDSIMTHTGILSRILLSLFKIPIKLKKFPFTSLSDFYHFNKVEGSYLGIGLKFNDGLNILKGGYGFSDGRWKYDFRVGKHIFGRNLSLGFGFYKRVTVREPEPLYSFNTETLLSLFYKKDCYDYFLSKGWSFNSRYSAPSIILEAEYFIEKQESLKKKTDFSLFRASEGFRENPPIREGSIRGLRVSLKFDTRKFIGIGYFKFPVLSEDSWVIYSVLEFTDGKFLKSDFDYIRFYLSLRRHQLTFASWYMDLYLTMGLSSGVLPPQKFFDIPGSIAGFSPAGSFKTLGVKEFSGDRLFTLLIYHNFGDFPLRILGIPLVKDLKMDFIVHGGAGWSDFRGYDWGERATESFFYEAGFGMGRIFSLFMMDFSLRLSHKGEKNFFFTMGTSL